MSSSRKPTRTSIYPSGRLDITISVKEVSPEPELWLPGMDVFSANSPPKSSFPFPSQAERLPTRHRPTTDDPAPKKVEGDVHPSCAVNMEPFKFPPGISSNGKTPDVNVVVAYMRQSGESEDRIRAVYSSAALLDYNCQLMLLEQQNRKRLALARDLSHGINRQQYDIRLRELQHDNEKRMGTTRLEHNSDQRKPLEAQSPQDRRNAQSKRAHALQDHQMQLQRLNQASKRHKMMASAGAAAERTARVGLTNILSRSDDSINTSRLAASKADFGGHSAAPRLDFMKGQASVLSQQMAGHENTSVDAQLQQRREKSYRGSGASSGARRAQKEARTLTLPSTGASSPRSQDVDAEMIDIMEYDEFVSVRDAKAMEEEDQAAEWSDVGEKETKTNIDASSECSEESEEWGREEKAETSGPGAISWGIS